jgi:hypothetical protein
MCVCVPEAFSLIKRSSWDRISTVGGLFNTDSVIITEVIRLQKVTLVTTEVPFIAHMNSALSTRS